MTTPVTARRPLFRRRRATALEHGLQVAVFDWRKLQEPSWPELGLLHAIPNGAGLKHRVKMKLDGKKVRYSAEGARLRREGLTAGMPDVSWPVPRGPYHGLYIEHKTEKGPVSDEQRKKIAMLEAQGYYVMVSRDSLVSIELIRAYWNLGPFSPGAAGLEPARVPPKRSRKTPTPMLP